MVIVESRADFIFLSRKGEATISDKNSWDTSTPGGGGGTPHMKGMGMLVGKV